MAVQQQDVADALAELSKLTTDELKELCNSNSNEKYDELVNNSAKVSKRKDLNEPLGYSMYTTNTNKYVSLLCRSKAWNLSVKC